MLKILTIVCVAASVLSATILQFWLKSKLGKGEKAARLLGILRNRNANFRLFQIPSFVLTVIILTVAIGMGTTWLSAAAYAVGAVICFATIAFSSGVFEAGSASAAYAAEQNNLPLSVKCSYRSGAVTGFAVCGAGMFLLGALFIEKSGDYIISNSTAIALGASSAALFLHIGGNIYSSSYAMAVSDKDFTDSAGFLFGSGADFLESYLISAAAAIMLSDLAVATSGITSTFTGPTAARFPLIVYAAGIAASIIGTILFRGGSQKNPAGNPVATCIVAGLISSGAALYFSNSMLQSFVYAFAAICGIAAGLILGLISLFFAINSRTMLANYKNDRKLGRHAQVIFNLGTGMVSSAIYVVFLIAALYVSFNFASYYGIALCAVGFCSIISVITAVSGLGIVSASSSEILLSDTYNTKSTSEDEADQQDLKLREEISDLLSSASAKAEASAGTFSSTASFFASAAMLSAMFYLSGAGSVSLISEGSISVLLGAMLGSSAIIVMFGIILLSIRFSGTVALRNMGRSDEEGATSSLRGTVLPAVLAIALPSLTGLLFGYNILLGFLFGAVFSGLALVIAIDNSGRHFHHTAVRSLNTIIKMMVVFSAVFEFVIIRIGGFIH